MELRGVDSSCHGRTKLSVRRSFNWGTSLLMVFSVTYTICKGLKLEVYMSQSIMLTNCWYDSFRQHKELQQVKKNIFIRTFRVAQWDTLDECLAFFSLLMATVVSCFYILVCKGKIFEFTNGKCHAFTF